ncbi:vesicle coat protein [Cladochytrium replicatum]|nr:vesicle coat protein [Cladochytrium replicatum]
MGSDLLSADIPHHSFASPLRALPRIYGTVVLACFCDQHGPAVVSCTQAVQDGTSPSIPPPVPPPFPAPSMVGGKMEKLYSGSPKPTPNELAVAAGLPGICSGCSPTFLPSVQNLDTSPNSNVELRGYRSFDDTTGIAYYTGRYPYIPAMYSSIRQACVRSLSYEFCPGREGPILFGDEGQGEILSYLFKIPDNQARGFQRIYALLFLNRDRSFLVASWPFLVAQMKAIAMDLRSRADKVFKMERERSGDPSVGVGPHSRNLSHSQEQLIRRRGSQPPRLLSELLGSRDLFFQIHKSFTWLLKAFGIRVTEKSFNGRALIGTVAPDPPTPPILRPITPSTPTSSTINIPSRTETLHLRFTSIHQLLRAFSSHGTLRSAIHQVLIGNQIVVRGDEPAIVSSTLQLFQELVPHHCVSALDFSQEYEESWKYNFIGISRNTALPKDLSSNHVFLIEVIPTKQEPKSVSDYELRVPPPDKRTTGSADLDSSSATPTILEEMWKAITKAPEGESELLKMQLVFIKEQWLSKAKLYFRFSKTVSDKNGTDVPDTPTSLNNNKPVAHISVFGLYGSKKGSSTNGSRNTEEFLNYVGAHTNDVMVLRYWTKGLGHEFRKEILMSL